MVSSSSPSSKPNHHLKMRLNKALKLTLSPNRESYISPPYFPVRPHSKIGPISPVTVTRKSSSASSSTVSSSRSSIMSNASSMTEAEEKSGEYDLQLRAKQIMERLSSRKEGDLEEDETLNDLILKDVKVSHDEEACHNCLPTPPSNTKATDPRSEIFQRWTRVRKMGYQISIKEAVVDETQRKVWVLSEMSKEGGEFWKERVDMFSFDWEGRLCETVDWYRRRRGSGQVDKDED